MKKQKNEMSNEATLFAVNKPSIHIFTAVTLLLVHLSAGAYELGTHARLTYKAYEQSVLKKDDKLIKDLGIDLSSPNDPFGTVYYDASGTSVSERNASTFEAGLMDDSDNPNPVIPLGTNPLSLPGWLLRGAIREDDWTGVNIPGCVVQADNPQDDPYSNPPDRPSNHFYDPIYNQPLTVIGPLGKKAPDWASGTDDVFNQPNTPENGRRNHFTVFDAREALYRALTGLLPDDAEIPVPSGSTATNERKKYWATTFRALGDIVHLVQDMGQPQHTRNDPHFGNDCYEALTGHKSLYEAYIETRAAAKAFELPSGDKFIPPPLTYDGYATPRFTDYLSYFTTRHKEGDLLKRQGLADYSNRGFFSAGKNLNPFDPQYEYPSNNAPSYGRQTVQTNWIGVPFGGAMTLFIGSVPDSLTGQNVANVPLTAIGAWDQFLEQKNLFSISRYTLVRENYDAQADLLIPRAVAYSAGLIDYFFRGRIEAEDAHYTEADTRRTT